MPASPFLPALLSAMSFYPNLMALIQASKPGTWQVPSQGMVCQCPLFVDTKIAIDSLKVEQKLSIA